MDLRLELHSKLSELTGIPSTRVYFQAPPNIMLHYPCIIYSLSDIYGRYADNGGYMSKDEYTITVIDRDPDSGIHRHISELPLSSFDRFYTADNLNHYVYRVYY